MARYIKPVCRLCRRAGEKLMLKGERCFTPKCAVERRRAPPGQQTTGRRRRLSDRGVQLMEKQKVRRTYGILERQFKRVFAEAERLPGITGDNLLVLLERRLDNVVYRLGFADSTSQARQLVRHGHITVNGQPVNVPSHIVKEGDSISWKETSKKTEYYKRLAASIRSKTVARWLTLDQGNLVGQVVSLPTPEDVDVRLDSKAVTEYYSR